MPAEPTRAALFARYTREYPASEELFLAMGDCRFCVRTNSRPLAKELRAYFAPFLRVSSAVDITVTALQTPAQDLGLAYVVKQPDPGKTKIKEEWVDIDGGRVIRKRLTGMVFLFGEDENLALGDCEANPNQVVNFINNRFIEKKLGAGCLLAHAAGVAQNGRGIGMAGFSGMGKSTLALHLVSRGLTFVSNDRLLIAAGAPCPTMYGVAKHPRINPGTALANPDLAGIVAPEDKARFLALPADELWALEHKYDALIDQLYGPDRFVPHSSMDFLLLLNWYRDGSSTVIREVRAADRHDLLAAFMKDTGLFFRADSDYAPTVRDYVRALNGCRVFEASGGVDFDAAADFCQELVNPA